MPRSRVIDLVLTLTTLLVFLPASLGGFVNYDDPDYVTANRFVNHGFTWAGVHWAFTHFYASNWHPLTWLSHMLDCQLFGLNPAAHHFINVLWHVANVGLLFAWLVRLTGKPELCGFIAALFAWHPLHVESVAWIAERKDVLSTFFALLTLLMYTRYAQEREKRREGWWLALLFFALGLMAKPMLVTLPFVLLLLDFWPLNRLVPFTAAVLVEKIPFFALAAVSCAITFIAQRQNEAVASLSSVSVLYRVENVPVEIVGYLQKLFLPVDLCVFYPMRLHLSGWQVVVTTGILFLISALAWRWRRTRPYFLFGWLWFLGTLVPVVGLVQVGVQAMADRYTYIPSIGFFIMVVFLVAELAERWQIPSLLRRGAAVAVCIGCIAGTEYQLTFWHDSESLFRRALAVTRDNPVAHIDLGAALMEQRRYDEAFVEFQQALRLRPAWYQIHNNLANILNERGERREAVAEYQKSIQLDSRVAFVHKNLGRVYTELGWYDDAEKEFTEAERLDAANPMPHYETAILRLAQSRDAEALAELRRAIQLQPDNPDILAFTARVLAADENAAGRDEPAARELAQRARTIADGNPSVLDALGMTAANSGDFTNALANAQEAFDIAAKAGLPDTNAMQLHIHAYQEHQPWRESFAATNAAAAR